MGIKTVPQPPHSLDLAPCDFCLFPKLRHCRYERIEEMKEAVTKVIDTLTQENFYGAFEKLLEQYNKCIAAGGDCFEGDYSFMCILSIKVPTGKKSRNLFDNPRTNLSMKNKFSYLLAKLLYMRDWLLDLREPSQQAITVCVAKFIAWGLRRLERKMPSGTSIFYTRCA